MKRYEKILLTVFGIICGAFLVNVLFRLGDPDVKEAGDIFNSSTRILSIPFAISVLGMITVLVNARLRRRREAGLPPISKLYRASFWLSFVPFVLLLIESFASAINGSTFLFDTYYGGEAFQMTFVLMGVLMFSYIVPLFPLMIFWQILYLVSRARAKKNKVK
ncbi:MAG: hypothetical protein IJ071_08960 [Ruminococcus sp.]|nr:hypothetical protein [Ruminococcus sp.]